VVFTGVRRRAGQDGQLVDVRIVFGVGSLQFRVERFIAGAGQAGIAPVDLDVGISLAEGKATYRHISDMCYLLCTMKRAALYEGLDPRSAPGNLAA
jgi:hypothetical protein